MRADKRRYETAEPNSDCSYFFQFRSAKTRVNPRLNFFRSRSLAAGDDRAGVTHATPRRRRLSGDESHDWFSNVVLCERCGFLFSSAADLADHHDSIRLIISLEQSQRVNVRGADNWIATNADGC